MAAHVALVTAETGDVPLGERRWSDARGAKSFKVKAKSQKTPARNELQRRCALLDNRTRQQDMIIGSESDSRYP